MSLFMTHAYTRNLAPVCRFTPSRSPSRSRPSVLLTPPPLRRPPPPAPLLVPRLAQTPAHLQRPPLLARHRATTVRLASSRPPVSLPRLSLPSASCSPERELTWTLPALGLSLDEDVGRDGILAYSSVLPALPAGIGLHFMCRR